MSPAIEHPPRCLLLATLDTKGAEAAYVREQLIAAGIEVTLIDCGCLGEWVGAADVSRESVMAAGGGQLAELAARGDRGAAIRTAAAGAAKLVREAYDRGEADGVLALGGSAGTTKRSRCSTARCSTTRRTRWRMRMHGVWYIAI